MAKNVEDILDQFDDSEDKIAELEALASVSSTLDEFLALAEPKVAAEEKAKKVEIVIEKPNSCFYCDCEPVATLQNMAVCEYHLLSDGECSKCHKGASTPVASPVSAGAPSTSQMPLDEQAQAQVNTDTNSDASAAVEERASTGVLATNQAEYNEEFKQIYNKEFLILNEKDSLVFAEERKDQLERFIRECKIKIAAIQGFQDEKAKRARKTELAEWEEVGKKLAARKPKAPKADAQVVGKKAKSEEEKLRETLAKLRYKPEDIEKHVADWKTAKGLK